MKKILFLLSSLFTILGNAQSISELDKKNGFKDFKLGDDFSKWSSQVAYSRTNEDGLKVYSYVGNCCNKVFDYKLNTIELGFLNSKLVLIYLETEKFQKPYSESKEFTTWRNTDFESINNSFQGLFGKPTGHNSEGDISFFWQSQKVMLRSTYKYLGVREGDMQVIFVFSLDYLKNIMNSGF